MYVFIEGGTVNKKLLTGRVGGGNLRTAVRQRL
jgi:hypothetical protein